MDSYSGLPYWIVKNAMNNYFNPLKGNYLADVVIVGSGITGALVAHELCDAGLKCIMIDKQSMSTGSSIANTALLRYDLDIPLCKLADIYGEQSAVKVYRSSLQSITDIESVFRKIGCDPDFERVPSLCYASNYSDLNLLKDDYQMRKKYLLPVTLLKRKELYSKYGIEAPGALETNTSAQIDAYKAATQLITYHMDHSELEVFTHTRIERCEKKDDLYHAISIDGFHIKAQYIVIATGHEADQFLPEKLMNFNATYAILSEPIEDKYLWNQGSLIREVKRSSFYTRTVNGNRIIVGGEDESYSNPVQRSKMLGKKAVVLENKFHKIFPNIPFRTELVWCGTFSHTSDGLPYIGALKNERQILYALGYGGNGITFSMIAAQVIRNHILNIPDDRSAIYGFDRDPKMEENISK